MSTDICILLTVVGDVVKVLLCCLIALMFGGVLATERCAWRNRRVLVRFGAATIGVILGLIANMPLHQLIRLLSGGHR